MARELLTESGSIFVQIGDENVHLVRCLLDEVFGSDNFISQITVKKTTSGTGNYLGGVADYIIWHAKNIELTKFKTIYAEKEIGGEGTTGYTKVELPDGKRRSMTSEELRDPSVLPKGSKIFSSDNRVVHQ